MNASASLVITSAFVTLRHWTQEFKKSCFYEVNSHNALSVVTCGPLALKSSLHPFQAAEKKSFERLLGTLLTTPLFLLPTTIHPPLISRRKVSSKKTLLKTTLHSEKTTKAKKEQRSGQGPPNNAADFSPLHSRGKNPGLISLQKSYFLCAKETQNFKN